jgi:hypothetical protein
LIQHTISTTFNSLKIYFNEIYLFRNSPVQPLATMSDARQWTMERLIEVR